MNLTHPLDLTAIKALLEAGTPRPWRIEDRRPPRIDGPDRNIAAYSEGDYGWKVSDLTAADADLIVAAVNALPQLLTIATAAFAWRDNGYPADEPLLFELRAAIDAAREGK